MRILHTSDWHLGRSFHREDMLGPQGDFVDHLVEVVRTERVEVVAVSGDLYDRALPPVDAVRLCDTALRRLVATGARVVIISGNHDSARRLGFGADLMSAAGLYLRTDPREVGTPVLLDDAHGTVALYGIPYVEPELVKQPWGLPERGHPAALSHAMDLVRADHAARPARTRAVVLAHAFVTGGEASDSERDISVGGVAQVPASVFDGVDYVALGHLHGRQTLREAVRYSGSPLAYSFSETGHRKGSWLVDLGPEGVTGVEFVPAPVPRPLARISGDIETLLRDPGWSAYEEHWLQVTLTDPARPRAPMERLRTRFPHVLTLAFTPSAPPDGDAPVSRDERLRGLTEVETSLRFVREVRGEPADTAETQLLRQAFEECRREEAAR